MALVLHSLAVLCRQQNRQIESPERPTNFLKGVLKNEQPSPFAISEGKRSESGKR